VENSGKIFPLRGKRRLPIHAAIPPMGGLNDCLFLRRVYDEVECEWHCTTVNRSELLKKVENSRSGVPEHGEMNRLRGIAI
jgi:hypothetical protein